MKIYTKTGDSGETSLIGRTRVHKNDARIEAVGTLDELDSFVGWLKNLPEAAGFRQELEDIQRDLAVVNTVFAADPGCQDKYRLDPKRTEWLETRIDRLGSGTAPLTAFPLPGENMANAACNVCRTVCRRAERRICDLEPDGRRREAACYINRLSDYFYILGRFFAQKT